MKHLFKRFLEFSSSFSRSKPPWLFLTAGVFLMFLILGLYFFVIMKDLPKAEVLKVYKPPLISFVLDRRGEIVGEFFKERRILSPYEEFPDSLVKAFVAAEDGSFFKHKGLNIKSIFRAFLANLQAGKKVQGGSTITQQAARALLLSSEKTYTRKIKEAILARRMEKTLSKEHILYLYLNQIYLGHGAYGVGMASQIYFRKKVKDLTLAESALLAGLPQAPSRFSPIYNPQKAKERQLYVLERMQAEEYISKELAEETARLDLKVFLREELSKKAPYYTETLRRLLTQKLDTEENLEDSLDEEDKDLLIKGWRIKSGMDFRLQSLAQEQMKKGLEDLDKRQGFRGPLNHFKTEEEITDFFKTEEEKILNQRQKFQIIKAEEPEVKKEEANVHETKLSALNQTLKGVVREVDDVSKQVLVQLAFKQFGFLTLEDMAWARPPDPKVYYSVSKILKPSRALKAGDLILVNIIKPEENETKKDEPANFKFFKTQNLAKTDVKFQLSLDQEPLVQGALIAFDQKTGDILAMTGGYDFDKSQFNRAYQARRQTGSIFKPLVYTSALDKGFTPVSIISDAPAVFKKGEVDLKPSAAAEAEEEENSLQKEEKWKPGNYNQRFSGDTLFRQALIQSMNVPTVKIIESVGIKWAIDYAQRLGIFSPLNPDYTLALGSSSVTLYEMTKAFSIIGRMGKNIKPILAKEVLSSEGEPVFENLSLDSHFLKEMEPISETMEQRRQKYLADQDFLEAQPVKTQPPFFFKNPEKVLSSKTAFIMHSLLEGVIKEPQGTGFSARDIGKHLAGKTGTTNGYYDAWFIGYSPEIAVGVWVGFDNEQSLGRGETGAKAALPIWREFMKPALKLFQENADFKAPEGVIFINIDNETGKLVNIDSKNIVKQAFIEGTEPTEGLEQEQEEQTEDQDFLREDL